MQAVQKNYYRISFFICLPLLAQFIIFPKKNMDDAENTFGPSNYAPCGCVTDPSVLYTPKTCIISCPNVLFGYQQ